MQSHPGSLVTTRDGRHEESRLSFDLGRLGLFGNRKLKVLQKHCSNGLHLDDTNTLDIKFLEKPEDWDEWLLSVENMAADIFLDRRAVDIDGPELGPIEQPDMPTLIRENGYRYAIERRTAYREQQVRLKMNREYIRVTIGTAFTLRTGMSVQQGLRWLANGIVPGRHPRCR